MTVIAEKDRPIVRDLLAREMVEDVELVLFTRGRADPSESGRPDCLSCEETRELLDELAGLSECLHLTTYDLDAEPETARRYNVQDVPTVIIRRLTEPRSDRPVDDGAPGGAGSPESDGLGSDLRTSATERGANVRFLGLPSGYEFSTLLADVIDISKGRTDLMETTVAAVQAIDAPVTIKVFVTPT